MTDSSVANERWEDIERARYTEKVGHGFLPHTPTRTQLAVANSTPIEAAHARGKKEGFELGRKRLRWLLDRKNKLGLRYKAVVGDKRRLEHEIGEWQAVHDALIDHNRFLQAEVERLRSMVEAMRDLVDDEDLLTLEEELAIDGF